MTAWPQAIGEETSRVLRAAQQQNEEFQKTEAAAWHQERREWIRQTNEALRHGQAIAKSHEAQNTRQEKLIERQEKQQEEWILGHELGAVKGARGGAGVVPVRGHLRGDNLHPGRPNEPDRRGAEESRDESLDLSASVGRDDGGRAAENPEAARGQDGRAIATPADLVAARGQLAAARTRFERAAEILAAARTRLERQAERQKQAELERELKQEQARGRRRGKSKGKGAEAEEGAELEP